MERDELFVPEDDMQAFEPHVPVVNKATAADAETFWERIIRETEEEDARALAGGAIVEASADAETDDGLSFEERYERLMKVIANKPSHREILLRTLGLCCEDQSFEAVEQAIASYPEFPAAGQNPFRLITFLIDGGGLEQIAVDAEGAAITPQRTAGMTEDEADDLIAGFRLRTTEVGRQVAEDHSVKHRMDDLFSMLSDRVPSYTELLEFCREPRAFKDIESLFAGRDLSGLRTLHPESGLAIKPSVFVDNMEKAGALVWKKDGWVLTEEGGKYLETIMRGSM